MIGAIRVIAGIAMPSKGLIIGGSIVFGATVVSTALLAIAENNF
jgi:hypothetical protein